jgi:hypothetical protein
MQKTEKKRNKNDYEVTFWFGNNSCVFYRWYKAYTKKEAIAKAKAGVRQVLQDPRGRSALPTQALDPSPPTVRENFVRAELGPFE